MTEAAETNDPPEPREVVEAIASDETAAAIEPAGKAAPAKADPETLVLRAQPDRVTRFRRGAIIIMATAGSIMLAGTVWLALRSTTPDLAGSNEVPETAGAKGPPEALAGAPENYGDVPELGAPLPGDLGEPILNHRRALGMAPGEGADEASRRAAQAAEAERQRLAAEERAARESSVMVQIAGDRTEGSAASGLAANTEFPPPAQVAQTPDPHGQQPTIAMIRQTSELADVSSQRLMPPASPWILQAGSVIAASLITGIDSDLPGLVTAQVTEHVYDSLSGQQLLIPQGSRLIGSYDSMVGFGQSRALVVWQRLILPNGSSIRLDNVPATDTQGYAGLSDRIDRHTWQMLKGVGMSTLLGVGTELSFGSSESDLVRAVREAAQRGGARAGDQLVMRNLDIPPTLRVRPGWPLRVVVHEDIVLRPRGTENG